jgi:transposase-like protein
MNQILQAEMTEYLGVTSEGQTFEGQTDERRGSLNGSYGRMLTARIEQVKPEVLRDRDETLPTKPCGELCGREFRRQTLSSLAKSLGEQVQA